MSTRIVQPLMLGCALSSMACQSEGARGAGSAPLSQLVVFRGACDASGAVPLDRRRFAVADDEDSVLRVYDVESGGEPLYTVDLAQGLDLTRRKGNKKRPKKQPKRRKVPETDIEAATFIGERAYWITSHALTKSGKRDPARFRFFATALPTEKGPGTLIGAPYRGLVDAMLADTRLNALGLAEASRRSPEHGGLNIEGMTATPDGKLLLGLRNPVPHGKGLVFTLENPDAVLRGERARFGAPHLLDLGGLGVRGLSWWRGDYLVIAGGPTAGGESHLYRWQGRGAPQHMKGVRFGDLNPEGFFTPEDRKEILILSDDGARSTRGRRCKDLDGVSDKQFRGLWVQISHG